MKIRPEHLEYMNMKIFSFLDEHPNMQEKYEKGEFPRSENVKDLQKRFNFDLYHFSIKASWVCENLYPYIDDTHIASALRAICPTLTRKY